MTESDDSPLPKLRKKYVPPGPSSILLAPESPLNLVIKRRAIKNTPPEPDRSYRAEFLNNPLFEHEAKETGSDGKTNSSVSDFSSDDDDIDDSAITDGSHPDGSPSIYMQGLMSQNDLFSTPLHKARHSGRVPLHQDLEARLIAQKSARKHARFAAEAVASKGTLLDIAIPALVQPTAAAAAAADINTTNFRSAAVIATSLPGSAIAGTCLRATAVATRPPAAAAITATTSPPAEAVHVPPRKVIIPLMFRLHQAILPVPLPVPMSSKRSPAPSRVQSSLDPVPLSFEVINVPDSPLQQLHNSAIVPESPLPELPKLISSSNKATGRQPKSRMKLERTVRSIAVQTLPQQVDIASVAVQTCDVDSPITLIQLRSELQSLHALIIGLRI